MTSFVSEPWGNNDETLLPTQPLSPLYPKMCSRGEHRLLDESFSELLRHGKGKSQALDSLGKENEYVRGSTMTKADLKRIRDRIGAIYGNHASMRPCNVAYA